MTDAVRLHDVTFAWRGGFRLVLPHLAIAAGERALLLGPSGSGKSTLLGLLGGVLAPAQGRVQVLGQDLGALSARARDRFRGDRCGIVFQQFNLLPYATVLDNVLLPLRLSAVRRQRAGGWAGATREVRRLLRALDLDSALERTSAATLSIGQQQRVAVARALLGAPGLILADEPTSALDAARRAAFLDLLFTEAHRVGTTVVVVSHDATLTPLFNRALYLPAMLVGAREAA